MIGSLIKTYNGKKYGNRIADRLGVHRGLFHSALEEGGLPMHMMWLYFLKKQDMAIDDAASSTTDFLTRGLLEIEKRFGRQPLIEEALDNVKAFTNSYIETATEEAQDSGRVVSSVFSDGRYELSYNVEMVQRIRGKEFVSKEPYVNRSDDLEGLRSMAKIKRMSGVEVKLTDLHTGKELTIGEM